MSLEIDITDYFPELDTEKIGQERILEINDRFREILFNEFPELKTSPNSTFGEFFLKPLALITAMLESGVQAFVDDFDLNNVSEGNINNCDLVKIFLRNLGVQESFAAPSIGTVRIDFSENKQYVIDPGSGILFGDDKFFNALLARRGPILIDPVGSAPRDGNWFSLAQTDANTFSIDLPVIGKPAAVVDINDDASTDIPDPEIRRIFAVENFKEGTFTESVPELAKLSQKIFNASSLTTKGGAISFLIRQFPNLQFVSPVISGEQEMQRDKFNVLGFSEGKLDIYAKQNKELLTTTVLLKVADASNGKWVGRINSPEIIQFINGFKDSPNSQIFFSKSDYTISGRTTNTITANKLSATYSEFEELGLSIDNTAVQNIQTFGGSNTSAPTNVTISGAYNNHEFSSSPNRVISVALLEDPNNPNTKAKAVITDINTKEKANAVFDYNSSTQTFTLNVTESDDMTTILTNGISLDIERDISLLSDKKTAANTFDNIQYSAQYKIIACEFRYDPVVKQINTVIESPDVRPAISTIAKAPIACKVNKLKVNYRRAQGTFVDRQLAKDEIFNYVNSVGYPDLYEESAIIDIMLFAGAVGVSSLEENCEYFPTVADIFYNRLNSVVLNKDSSLLFNELELDSLTVSDVDNSLNQKLKENALYLGSKNVHYILDKEDIIVNEIISR